MATHHISDSPAMGKPISQPLTDRKVLGLCSLIVGLGLIYFVGFAPMMAVHNAAHDTRHASAFPCH
jgi:cobalt transporter subunit CbtB